MKDSQVWSLSLLFTLMVIGASVTVWFMGNQPTSLLVASGAFGSFAGSSVWRFMAALSKNLHKNLY